jgi:pyrroline-5-carboxylate reductase
MKKTTADETAAVPSLLERGQTFGVIGTGIMGQTILKGLLNAGALESEQAWGVARSARTCEEASRSLGIVVEREPGERVRRAGIIVLSVKPTQAGPALATLREAGLRPDTLLVSILAGTSLQQLESLVGTSNPWVGAMPNTPSVVGEGMTVICGGTHASAEHLARARQIFEAVGRCVQADEQHFNAVTALSGSGPAYQYLIMEAMADAGVRVGLPRDLALTLVAQTALGAARMVLVAGRHPAALRDDVTTPAGCTIGGLLMLEDGKIRSVLARAIEEATRIAARLGPSSSGPKDTPTH